VLNHYFDAEMLLLCQIGHGQPPVAFPSSQPDRKASAYASQQQQQPTASQSACELCDYFHHSYLNDAMLAF